MSQPSRTRISPLLLALGALIVGLFWLGSLGSALAVAPQTQIVVDDGDVTVQPGDTFTYTVQFSSAVTATNVVITQSVPADVHFQRCEFQSPHFGSCTSLANAVRIELSPDLTPTTSGQLKTVFVVGQAVTTDIDSIVTMAAQDEIGAALPVSTANVSTAVHLPKPLITVQIDDGVTDVQPGDSVAYVLSVNNAGDAAAQNVQVSVALPTGLRFDTASDGGTANPAGVIVWPHFNLVVNGSAQRTINAVVDLPIAPSVNAIIVTANLTFDGASSPAPFASDIDSVISDRFVGRIWRDNNGNGLQDAEPGFGAVAVTASSPGLPTTTVSTNAQGTFVFDGMPLRAFLVEAISASLPGNVRQTFESDGTLDGRIGVDVTGGVQRAAADFGFATPTRVADSFAWVDLNANGRRDPDEPSIPGIDMTLTFAGPDGLFDTADDQLFTAATGSDGRYGFENLTPGLYRLTHDPTDVIPGYKLTTYPRGAADAAVLITLVADHPAAGLDFGFAVLDLSVNKNTQGIEAATSSILPYSIAYANNSLVDAQAVLLSETVPQNSTFLPESSHPDWVCSDGNSAGSRCDLRLGSVAAQSNGSINFTVQISDSMPAHVNAITNTVEIADTSAETPDPTPDNNRYVAVSSVDALPDLTISQSDGNTRTEPSKTLIYAMNYANQGNQTASGVEISILVPNHTSFNAAVGSQGWSCPNGSGPGVECTLAVGTLAAGDEGSVNFAMTVNGSMPVNVASITAEVTISDDVREHDRDGELTPVDATPDLILAQSDDHAVIQPGETIRFTLNYTNNGNRDAIGVLILETVPEHVQFNQAAGTLGWDCPDGEQTGQGCIYSIGALAAGDSGSVVFAVTLDADLPDFVDQIRNIAVIAGSGIELDIDNNQTSSSVDVLHPTAVDLVSFTATAQNDSTLLLEWVTSAERNSWGFLVHRSTDLTWKNAVRVNPRLIESTGDEETGAYYVYADTLVVPGVTYYYWLQELEIDGGTNVYGPISGKISGADVPSGAIVFLPLVMR